MKKIKLRHFFLPAVIALTLLGACDKNDDDKRHNTGSVPGPGPDPGTEPDTTYRPPRPYNLVIPKGFPLPGSLIPQDNPLTVEGVELGRHLFYDKRLSKNNTISCASCHKQEYAFSDGGVAISPGFDGVVKGTRNAMSLTNVLWSSQLNWDGSAGSLEEQAIIPLTSHVEMNQPLDITVGKLQNTDLYPELFKKAFGSKTITQENIFKALSQFQRTLISGNAKWDKYRRGEAQLTAQEEAGRKLFFTHTPYTATKGKGANCFDCHGNNLFAIDKMANNGLDAFITDQGLGAVTGKATDIGLFKTPTLRNIALTGPYMHDGRFKTLREVIEHYNSGIHFDSPNLAPDIVHGAQYPNAPRAGLLLEDDEIDALIAFLNTLTDEDFITDKKFSDPFKK